MVQISHQATRIFFSKLSPLEFYSIGCDIIIYYYQVLLMHLQVRWVVESANARIKRWKFLGRALPTNQVPFIRDYVRIVCAISNKFFPPLSSTVDRDADESEAAKMRHLSNSVNVLKEYLEDNNMIRKSTPWKPIDDDDLDDFPYLDDSWETLHEVHIN